MKENRFERFFHSFKTLLFRLHMLSSENSIQGSSMDEITLLEDKYNIRLDSSLEAFLKTFGMEEISIAGTITTDYKRLFNLLEGIVEEKEKLILKIRIMGEEINYSDGKLDLYIYSLGQQHCYELGVDDFQMEGSFIGNFNQGKTFLENFATIFSNKEIPFILEYCLVDDQGNCLGDEYEFRFPLD